MNENLDKPLPRPQAARDLEARIQKSFSTERQNLIDEAERVYWNNTFRKPKKEFDLGELIDQALRDWIEKQEKASDSGKLTSKEK